MTDGTANRLLAASDSFVSLGDRARRVAGEDGVSLDYRDGVWTATDTTTGERASCRSMAGAWAGLRDVGVFTVHGWLEERDAAIVRPPSFPGGVAGEAERTTGDARDTTGCDRT